MINVMIADDHKVFRDGIVSILGEVVDIQISAQAGSSKEVIELLEKEQPEVILMDITMGATSGIEVTKIVKDKYPNIRILILSMHSESSYIVKALEAGANGYLLKDAGSTEMINAIRRVHDGATYYSQQVSSILVQHITQGTQPKASKSGISLTPREIEILKLIAEEFSNPEIAKKLFISIRTVDTHRRNLLEKLGVKNTAGLVRYALRHGIVE
ncbi:MAG: response regulator [Saprospiraceae bacterium]